MRIVIHAPFGTLSQEVGVIYLLGNYLRTVFPEVIQLKCNGIFSCCDRDGAHDWQRGMDACFTCINEQNRLAAWSSLGSEYLSKYLLPEDIESTKRLVLGLPAERLQSAAFNEGLLFDLCKGSFRSRFGVEAPDPANKNHVHFLRRAMLGAVRMCLAVERFNNRFMPDISLVAGGRDFVTRSFIETSRRGGYQAVIFRWDAEARSVNIVNPRTHQVLVCDLLLEGISTMRPDVYSWPDELISIVQEILSFLEIAETQLTLPMAR